MTAMISFLSWLRFLARWTIFLVFGTGAAYASAQTVTFFHNDILGSPAVATNADGEVVWKEDYLPYGQPQQGTGTNNKLWFTGKPFDADTGLSYFGARYYIPSVGRFTGIDPENIVPEDPYSFNRYAYANNNPYKYIDPDGRAAMLGVWLVGAGIGVLMVGQTLSTPDKQAQLQRLGSQAWQNVSDALGQVSNWVFNEGANTPKGHNEGADKPADIVAPGGVPVGENIVGAKPGVQTVPPDKLTDIIDRLKGTGAVPDPNSRYPGDWYNLPGNQGGFGVRNSRDNGRTVDVNIPGVPDVTKIHER